MFVTAVAISIAAVPSASAFSSNPLFRPAAGQGVLGVGGVSTLTGAGLEVECDEHHVIAGNIVSSLLVGGLIYHYLGCEYTKGEAESGCPANSVGEAGGVIVTTKLHAILGLLLPSKVTGLLFLPQAGKVFTTLAAAERNGRRCAPELKIEGNVTATIDPVGVAVTEFDLDAVEKEISEIDLTHGLGLVKAKLLIAGEGAILSQSTTWVLTLATEIT
ncbi:MAG TPA: hypothetical protein VIH71_09450 [Solirubrobacteraceae bacterium]